MRIEELDWYHTLELAPDVVTPGWFDLRQLPARIGFPPDLSGRRCLDVGTFDGFWAFEMERRGASEVVAIDVLDPRGWDWPAGSTDAAVEAIGRRKAGGAGFELAREAIGSAVKRLELSVYDLDPEAVGGPFDFVHVGSLLVHLRDPVGALERVREVCQAELLVVDGVSLVPGPPVATLDGVGRPWWWKPNARALARWIEAAGFQVVEGPRRVRLPPGPGQPRPRLRPRLLRSRGGREALVSSRIGDPHAAVRARPA